MSYMILPHGAPNTKKFFLSVWFRVPQSSIDAARAEVAADGSRPMAGVIPIVVFGPPTVARVAKNNSYTSPIGGYDFALVEINTFDGSFHYASGYPTFLDGPRNANLEWTDKTEDMEPSYIGVDCRSQGDGVVPNHPRLAVNIAMSKNNLASKIKGGYSWAKSTAYYANGMGGRYFGSIANCQEVTDGPLTFNWVLTQELKSDYNEFTIGAYPERFRTLPLNNSEHDPAPGEFVSKGDYGKEITANHWHHLMVSFEAKKTVLKGKYSTRVYHTEDCNPIGGYCTSGTGGSSVETHTDGEVTSCSRMHIALDDQNLTGRALTVYRPDDGGSNDIIGVNGYRMYRNEGYDLNDTTCAIFGIEETRHLITLRPEYEFTPEDIPLNEGKIASPAGLANVPDIKHVETGLLMMFTDEYVDTAEEKVRRAFITDKGKPAKLEDAVKLIGKKPEIYLPRRTNWKQAKNAGTYNPDPDPDGGHPKGETKALIKTYNPDPNLDDEKQGKPQ